MRDPITDAAQDPSCLLCLTPDRGGSWWSRLRPPTPRVFSTSAYWPGFVSAFNSNGIKNYRFSIRFSLSEMPSRDRVLFGNQMALGEGRFMLVLSSKGKIQVQDESSWSGIVEHPISGTGKHTVVIEIAESSGRIMVDGVEYAVSVSRTAPILTIAFSNFPGTISSILLEADSGTLWQATYSELYAIYEPRNFSAAPMMWSSFETLTAGYNGDFIFRIVTNFRSISDNPQKNEFFFNSRWVPFAFRMNSETRLFGWLNGSDPDAGVELSIDLPVSILGMHVLKVARTGLEFVVTFDGVEVYRKSVDAVRAFPEPTSSSAIRSHYHSDFDGSITEVEFSAPALSWSAPHGDLYDMLPPPPWPSPVPRNFAEEPATWYDLGLASSTIGMDDWEIGGELYANSLTAGKSIIYRSSNPRFGLYVTSSSQIIFVNYSATGGNERIYYYDNPPTGEWLSFKMQRAGGWLRWLINDIDVNSVEKTGLYVEMNNTSPFFVNEDCNLRNCYFKNLTTGRTVWSYPSEAERVRLITKTNVRTDRGYFEQVDTTVNSYVNTALDLRGRVSSYTVFIDFYPAVFPESNNAECHQELAGQGGALIDSGFPPICSVGYYKTVDQTYRLQFAQQSGSLRRTVNVTLAAALSGRCRIVGVVDVQSSSTTLTLYLDGEQIGTSTYSGIPDGTAASIARCFSVAGVKEYVGWINYTGKVYSCLLFDRALSAAEIAALTPKQA